MLASIAWPSWVGRVRNDAEGLSFVRFSSSGEGEKAGEHRGVPTGAGVAAFLSFVCEAQEKREKKKKKKKKKNREMARGTWPKGLHTSASSLQGGERE